VPNGEPPQKASVAHRSAIPRRRRRWLAGFRGPDGRDPDSLVLDLIEAALGFGEGARLKRALVYEQELCVDAHIFFGWRMDPGLFEVSLKLNPGVDSRSRRGGALGGAFAPLPGRPRGPASCSGRRTTCAPAAPRAADYQRTRHTIGQMR